MPMKGIHIDNWKAFKYYHYIIICGALIIGGSTLLYQMKIVAPTLWMILNGFGLYLCYVPFNGLFFDRMIATFRINGNSGFLIYIADTFGYFGSIGVLLYKNFGQTSLSWLQFFETGCYVVSIIGFVTAIISLIYYEKKFKQSNNAQNSLEIINT